MPGLNDSPEDRTNRNRGCGFGLAVAVPFVLILLNGNHRATPWWFVLGGPLAFTVVSVGMGSWAGVSIGRSPSGRGAGQGIASAMVSLVMLMLLGVSSDVLYGQKKPSEFPLSLFAGMFCGTIPAVALGLLAGLALSALVKRPPRPS
jgi:hypothetical protein